MLSIIIPTLNEEKILARTLSALRALHITQYEIIVSDGQSKDSTVHIARKLAHKVVVHEGSERQTIGSGKNLGAEAASGDFLVFIDADVFIPKINEFFSEALGLFKKDKDLVALTVFLKVLPEHVRLSDKLFFGLVNRIYQFSNNFLHVGAASGEFQMIRADVFKQIGGYDTSLVIGEDNEIFKRLSKVSKTRVETGLHVMHTSRRAHKVGWPRLLFLWVGNFAYTKVTKKSFSREWKVIR